MKLTEISKPARTLYVVRKVDTEEYLTSGKHAEFGGFNEAALYYQEKNAQDIIRGYKSKNVSTNQERVVELNSLNLEVIPCSLIPRK